MSEPKLLSVAEYARKHGIKSRQTVYNRVTRGEIESVQTEDGLRIVDNEQIDKTDAVQIDTKETDIVHDGAQAVHVRIVSEQEREQELDKLRGMEWTAPSKIDKAPETDRQGDPEEIDKADKPGIDKAAQIDNADLRSMYTAIIGEMEKRLADKDATIAAKDAMIDQLKSNADFLQKQLERAQDTADQLQFQLRAAAAAAALPAETTPVESAEDAGDPGAPTEPIAEEADAASGQDGPAQQESRWSAFWRDLKGLFFG